jgi:Tol biopolymer transport system component
MSEDLYLGERASTADPFQFVRRIDELATSGRDTGGSFADGARTLYFASQRTGGLGGLDLWSASRPDGTSNFGTPAHLANVNSADDEFDAVITPDGQEIFFASSRGGKTRLWHSLRRCVP